MLRYYPDCISRAILVDWLQLNDIFNLDASFCNVAERAWWLSMLKDCSKEVFRMSKMGSVHNALRLSLLNWVLKRNVQVSHLLIPTYWKIHIFRSHSDHRIDYIQQLGPSLLSLVAKQPIIPPVYRSQPAWDYPLWYKTFSSAFFANIAAYCGNLLRIELVVGGYSYCQDMHLLANCKKLQYIYLTDEHVLSLKKNVLQAFATLTDLRHIDIRCNDDDEHVGDVYVAIARSNPHLEYIALGNVYNSELAEMAKYCPKLQYLHVRNIGSGGDDYDAYDVDDGDGDDDDAFADAAVSAATATAAAASTAEKDEEPVSRTAALESLLTNCRHMKHLDILWLSLEGGRDSYYVPITDDTASVIATHCPQLESLRCNGLSSAALCAITIGCPNLTKLDLSESWTLDDAALRAIGKYCKKLAHINIHSYEKFTVAGVAALIDGCYKLQSFKFQYVEDCEAIANLAVNSGATLTSLDLRGNASVTQAALETLAAHCPQLDTLRLTLRQPTRVDYTAVVAQCRNIRTLVIECGVCNINELAAVIGAHCPQLERLSLMGAPNQLTEEGVAAIAQGCLNLRNLSLSYCGAVTSSAVFGLLQCLQRLNVLYLLRLDRLTAAEKAFLRQRYGQRTILHLNNERNHIYSDILWDNDKDSLAQDPE